MGIEKLKSSLLSEAQQESARIVEDAQKQAKTMLEEERARCAAMKSTAEKELESRLEEQREERLAWARLEARRILAEAREDAIKSVLEDFFEVLNTMRKSGDYKKLLSTTLSQAISDVGPGSTIHVLKGDKALLSAPKNVKVVEDLEGLGGLVAESANGKIISDHTIETIFETRRDEMRKNVNEKLFGGK